MSQWSWVFFQFSVSCNTLHMEWGRSCSSVPEFGSGALWCERRKVRRWVMVVVVGELGSSSSSSSSWGPDPVLLQNPVRRCRKALLTVPAHPKNPGRTALPRCALCLPVKGWGFLLPLIHPRPLRPSSSRFSTSSSSSTPTSLWVCQCAASIRASQSSWVVKRRNGGEHYRSAFFWRRRVTSRSPNDARHERSVLHPQTLMLPSLTLSAFFLF